MMDVITGVAALALSIPALIIGTKLFWLAWDNDKDLRELRQTSDNTLLKPRKT